MDQPNPTITPASNGCAASQITGRVCRVGWAKVKVRMVDITAQSYQIARQYMIRRSDEDLNDPAALGRYATLAGMSSEAFHSRFQPVGTNGLGTQSKGVAP